ncbi:MAG: histidine phosphatase family protein [Halofilum sp. (in: g-proteobacteria)]
MHPCLVIRHGAAEERAASGLDADRALTADGRDAMTDAARGLAVAAPAPDVVLTSPFTRAMETADVVARAFGGTAVEQLDALASGASAADILAALARRCELPGGGFAVVGHEPDLGRFISYALAASARGFHSPRKGGVCLLEFPATPRAGNATLDWIMEPRHLRAVGLQAAAER